MPYTIRSSRFRKKLFASVAAPEPRHAAGIVIALRA